MTEKIENSAKNLSPADRWEQMAREAAKERNEKKNQLITPEVIELEDKQAKANGESSNTLTKDEIAALLKDQTKETNTKNTPTSKKPDQSKNADQAKETELQMQQELERQRATEELQQNIQEQMELEQKLAERELYDNIQAQMELEEKNPLTAINIDYTHDEKEIAHDLAEQALNAEISDAKGLKGAVKRLWKGTLFKKYYETKYTKEFMSGDRKTENGETAMDVLKKQMPDTMERFVLGAVEDDSYIHRKIGKKDKDGNYKDGEKLEKLDDETNEKIKSAIAEYARRRPDVGEKVSDLNREFENKIGRILAELNDNQGANTSSNNYLEVANEAARRYQELAINAKTKAEHDAAIAQVMVGFQAYNAEARSNVRTEAHRDNIDKIVNALESSKIGQFIPAEIIAGAAGVAMGLTQTGARAAFGAAGGIIASSAISGLKERNRLTEDRARMLRDVTNGMGYDGSKYEKRIGGTLYDIKSASDLAANIKDAIDYDGKDRTEKLMKAIAEARVRIDFSDSEQKDLICYSSADNRGKERLALDVALIRAEKSLSDKDKKSLELMRSEIEEQIYGDVAKKDKDFKKKRALAAIAKSGKTLGLGTLVFFGSQEIMAALDPAKIGVFEKAGLLKTENNMDAKETLLAKAEGFLTKNRGTYEIASSSSTTEIHGNVSDPNQIKTYEEAGYTKVETAPASTSTTSSIEAVDPSASTARVDVKYDGWANNGTKFSDGNELRAHIEDGKFISTMRGASTMKGQSINYDPSTVKAYITIGDAKFEIAGSLNEAGQMTWGENGVFTTTTGETIKAIGDNGEKLYKYFEIAADNGVDTDGVQHIIPLATDIGRDTFAGKIEQVVETVTESPATYTFTKEIPGTATETFIRGIDFNGIGFAPETARRGLGRARAIETTPEPAPAPTPESVPAPEAPEPASDNLVYSRVEAPTAATSNEAEEEGTYEVTPLVSEDSPESVRDFVGNYQQAIYDRRANIGEELADALLGNPQLSRENQVSWMNSIRNLSQEGKAALREIVAMRDNLPDDEKMYLSFGNGFDAFLASQGPNVLN